MKIILFYHSLVSDWNHGNAHFLRGIATELIARGHQVEVYEPRNAWSVQNLISDFGEEAIREFHAAYPMLDSVRYDEERLALDDCLAHADLVIVHEWNSHQLVAKIGEHRRRSDSYVLLFHDTHHRALTAREEMAQYDLSNYDGVLAYGAVLRDIYLSEKWTERAWVWHEAADARLFRPHPEIEPRRDLVWIGNWGDDERSAELREFLIEPVGDLRLSAHVYGVRYPADAKQSLATAGIAYRGWAPNFKVPEIFAEFRMTIHVPRRPYVKTLRGIPTIRPFEALACGIPLISAPWDDSEKLFNSGSDYLMARNGQEMREQMMRIVKEPDLAAEIAGHGRATILARHTCGHRVEELLDIYAQITGR